MGRYIRHTKGAYYNENDPFCAEWLRQLIAAGHIASGDVDERDIRRVGPDDVRGYAQCHFFAGIGGWSLALRLAGWEDARECWTGSCPCQPFSVAGKRGGITDERHLWPEWYRLIRAGKPAVVFGEQVAGAPGLEWLDLVYSDLERVGYTCGAADLCAAGVGAPHRRQRLYFCADAAHSDRRPGKRGEEAGIGKNGERRGGSSSGGNAISRSESLHSERRTLLFDGSVQRGGQQRLLAKDCGIGDLGKSLSARLERRTGQPGDDGSELPPAERAGCESGGLRDSPERGQPVCGSSSGIARYAALTGATRGFWGDCDWWYGKDGKYRPIEPGLLPLAHGTPARVGRLRGYGNAIVPQVAAEFIGAYMSVCAIPVQDR